MYGPLKPTVTVRIPRFNIKKKKILRSVHRGRLCFYVPPNKQRLFPYTTFTGVFKQS